MESVHNAHNLLIVRPFLHCKYPPYLLQNHIAVTVPYQSSLGLFTVDVDVCTLHHIGIYTVSRMYVCMYTDAVSKPLLTYHGGLSSKYKNAS